MNEEVEDEYRELLKELSSHYYRKRIVDLEIERSDAHWFLLDLKRSELEENIEKVSKQIEELE